MIRETPPESDVRELAQRVGDGIKVRLLWSAMRDRVWVQVYDRHEGNLFEVPVAADQALNAFYHPYGYAALTGLFGAEVHAAA